MSGWHTFSFKCLVKVSSEAIWARDLIGCCHYGSNFFNSYGTIQVVYFILVACLVVCNFQEIGLR